MPLLATRLVLQQCDIFARVSPIFHWSFADLPLGSTRSNMIRHQVLDVTGAGDADWHMAGI
jgi:hypothetical protein